MMRTDLPPWHVVYQQTQRWLAAGVFQAMVDDLRAILRTAQGRNAEPTAVILDSRTLQSSPESGGRAGYDGAKRKKGSKVHVADVDAGYTGEQAAEDAQGQGIRLEVVKLPDAKRGFVLLPRRWVVERSFAWATRFRRLARDYERLPETLTGLHLVVFAIVFAARFVQLAQFLNAQACGYS